MRYSSHDYRVPGVHIEQTDASRVPPVVLRTDIAAFVGIAERGPLDVPVPVESVHQFAVHFGGFIGSGYLAYTVRAFFENGGRRCWVVRVAERDFSGSATSAKGAQAASIELRDVDGRPALRVRASSAGRWGNALSLQWSTSGAALATSIAGASTLEYAIVRSVAGFAADELVRIEQPGAPAQFRVIAAVDGTESKLFWVHPDPLRRRPSDRRLVPFDTGAALRIVRIAYSLVVRRSGDVIAQYRDLHPVSTHARFICTVLAPNVYASETLLGSAVRDGETSATLPRAPEPIVAEVLGHTDVPRPFAVPLDAALALAGGADGLVGLSAADFTGEPVKPNDSDFARMRKSRGVQALAPIDEIAIVAVPDILIQPQADPDYLPVTLPPSDPCIACPPPLPPRAVHRPRDAGELPPVFSYVEVARVQAALIEACEDAGDRIALLALPQRLAQSVEVPHEAIVAWRDQFESRVAALYAPWVEVAEPRGTARTRSVPPCGHVAGTIARIDLSIGVHRAPGNARLAGVVRVVRPVDLELHGALNEANVNALRAPFGQTPLIGGARTLSVETAWRYLNVVRLVLTIRKAADIALRWVVFEPNDRRLWASVRATLEAILALFFARGAFSGASAADAYFVRCDETTNPPEARETGRLVALLGFQPAAPCEFIVVRVGRQFAAPSVSLFAAEQVEVT